ncbi:unnamed protein product [Arabidopsis arenosa]|uniref:Uncharacterized protein n=1 Tax=Arabidopsis arenosa TaxID=38785 RepID=A0A8S2AV14_ARAAE|nr:unnamed protein product [Arabidopsis arenosa]
MTNDTTIVHESPSLLRAWWMNKNLRYDVAMSSIILIINIAAIVYMITHKIPLNKADPALLILVVSIIFYVLFGIVSCISWVMAIENVRLASEAYVYGRIGHTSGFGIFLDLLYSISPHLALHFGLPCLLWFVAAMIAPCCPYLWKGLCKRVQELRDWWKFVNRPQSSVVIV